MAERYVWTFFYGSFMNLDVLKAGGYIPQSYEVARLNGFDIRICPLATLVPSDQHCVYGIVALGTHEQLHRFGGGCSVLVVGRIVNPSGLADGLTIRATRSATATSKAL